MPKAFYVTLKRDALWCLRPMSADYFALHSYQTFHLLWKSFPHYFAYIRLVLFTSSFENFKFRWWPKFPRLHLAPRLRQRAHRDGAGVATTIPQGPPSRPLTRLKATLYITRPGRHYGCNSMALSDSTAPWFSQLAMFDNRLIMMDEFENNCCLPYLPSKIPSL